MSLRTTAAFVLIAAMILTPLTWARNTQWSSTLRLIESDYLNGARSPQALRVLTTTLISRRNFSRAEAICDEHADKFDEYWYMAGNCGQVYSTLKRYDLAEQAFLQAMKDEDAVSPAHYGLATLYIAQGRKEEAQTQFELSIAAENRDHLKEYLKAEKLLWLYPSDRDKLVEAKNHLEKSIQIQPRYYQARQNLDRIERYLDAPETE